MARQKKDKAVRRQVRLRLLDLQGQRSQEEFARALGVSPRQLSRWLTGDQGPSLDVLVQIAKRTETSLDWLLMGRERRTLEADEAVAGQLWHRVMKQATDEGADFADAEKVIPPPGELLEEVLGKYRGWGREVKESGSAIIALAGLSGWLEQLDETCDKLDAEMKEKQAQYALHDNLRMRLALERVRRK